MIEEKIKQLWTIKGPSEKGEGMGPGTQLGSVENLSSMTSKFRHARASYYQEESNSLSKRAGGGLNANGYNKAEQEALDSR